jgi:hypothetical protein
VSQAHDVRAHDVTRYRLVVRASPKSELADASGELVVSGGDEVDSLSLSVAKKATFADKGVTGALLYPLAPAFVLVLLGGVFAGVRGEWSDLVGVLPADVDSKSFASTLTAVGALLGTVIGAGVLPEETTTLSRAAFVALKLISGVGVVVAALVYAALEWPVWTDVEPKKAGEETRQQRTMHGTVPGFLVASLITVWAVFGELLTLWLLLDELGQDQGFSETALLIFKALIAIAAVTMCVYTILRILAIVNNERAKPAGLAPTQVSSRTVAQAQSIPLL